MVVFISHLKRSSRMVSFTRGRCHGPLDCDCAELRPRKHMRESHDRTYTRASTAPQNPKEFHHLVHKRYSTRRKRIIRPRLLFYPAEARTEGCPTPGTPYSSRQRNDIPSLSSTTLCARALFRLSTLAIRATRAIRTVQETIKVHESGPVRQAVRYGTGSVIGRYSNAPSMVHKGCHLRNGFLQILRFAEEDMIPSSQAPLHHRLPPQSRRRKLSQCFPMITVSKQNLTMPWPSLD